MTEFKVWKNGASGEPKFPTDFEITKKAVLLVTDIKTNRNKYYALELHSTKNKFRVFTHYGRTDDLESNPMAGMRESRYCDCFEDAVCLYDKIYREKTSARKGYREVNLASAKIGSSLSLGKSSGDVDSKTLNKLANTHKNKMPTSSIHKDVSYIVDYLYSEATNALTKSINATITANGIETPLGVLTIAQIDKGQVILDDLAALLSKRKNNAKLIELSGEFYSAIPHRVGRSRAEVSESVIDSVTKLNEKQDTLQLMRDMLSVNGDAGVLLNPEIDKKYKALKCEIEPVSSTQFEELSQYILKSRINKSKLTIKRIYKIHRKNEHESFDTSIGNEKLLFHGSAAKNWVGILSRGLLLPKAVVKLGVKRTDAGWLGSGLYFGDAVCTTYGYAHPGRHGTQFMTIAAVALGKVKQYRRITYGLSEPPSGYDSCHGVRGSEFYDDEFVIYRQNQQKLEYLVEYKQ